MEPDAKMNQLSVQPLEREAEGKTSLEAIGEVGPEAVLVERGDEVGQRARGLYYQDIMIYPNKEKEGRYSISGRRGRTIEEYSPLGKLKLDGERWNAISAARNQEAAGTLAYNLKLLLVVTLYDEDVDDFKFTMQALIKSIAELRRDYKLRPDAMAILFVADGYAKLSESVTTFLGKHGLFDESELEKAGYLINNADMKTDLIRKIDWTEDEGRLQPYDNICHLFQFANCTDSLGLENFSPRVDPYNFFFAIKHFNGGKLDSHLWALKGFAEYLVPEFCLCIDIGTAPQPGAISRFYGYLAGHPDCGGVCGEIEVGLGKSWTWSYPIHAAQFVEYKVSHYLDKAFENLFGYVSVLPGAFAAYRWASIMNAPLTMYFKVIEAQREATREQERKSRMQGVADSNAQNAETNPLVGAPNPELQEAQKKEIKAVPSSCCPDGAKFLEANMYLAEDRIMCLGIVANEERADKLAYIPGAIAVTDPPRTLVQLIKQRRRWINGSNFASFYVLTSFARVRQSKHNTFRVIAFFLLFIIQWIQALLTFLLVGCAYATFSIFARVAFLSGEWYSPSSILENAYLICIALTFIWGLSKDVDTSEAFYWVMTIIMGILMMIMAYMTYVYFFSEITDAAKKDEVPLTNYTLWLLIVLVASILIPSILNCCSIRHFFTYAVGFFFYLFFTPLYVNIFVIYAFSNTHDISWGNRPESITLTALGAGAKLQQQATDNSRTRLQSFRSWRTYTLIIWLVANLVVGYVMTRFTRQGQDIFVLTMTAYIGGVIVIKLICSVVFFFFQCCCANCCLTIDTHLAPITNILPPVKPRRMAINCALVNSYKPTVDAMATH